ncbi:MAG TPA: response regulator [Lacunisphaera sp.]
MPAIPTPTQRRSEKNAARSIKPLPPAATAESNPRDSTILLVDDDPAVLEGLRRVLLAEGWDVIATGSGENALEFLQRHQPDLMITDLSMDEVTGWDLLFHEKFQRPNLPVFVITALPVATVGGADRFAHEFFQKPLDLDALIVAIRRYIGTPRQNARIDG